MHRRSGVRADARELVLVDDPDSRALRIVRQLEQVLLLVLIGTQYAPRTAPDTVTRRVGGVQVIRRVVRCLRVFRDRHLQAELLRDTVRLEVPPAGVGRPAEAGAVGQPLEAMDRGLVLLFGRTDLDLDLHVVVHVGAHGRGERVAVPAVAVDAVARL